MNISGNHLSKEFFELVKAIGESRSKQEEDRIILAGTSIPLSYSTVVYSRLCPVSHVFYGQK